MNFKLEILINFEFWYQIFQQTVNNFNKFHSRFQLKSKREDRNNEL